MILRLHVKPGSRKTELWQITPDEFMVKVAAPPIDGKANEELIRFLATVLHIPKIYIRIHKGGNSRFKTFEIEGDETHILSKLRAASITK